MNPKRIGNAVLNGDSAGYIAAKKRQEAVKEQKRKDALIETLDNKVKHLEHQIMSLQEQINQIVSNLSEK